MLMSENKLPFLWNVSGYVAVAQVHTRQTLGSHPYLGDGRTDGRIFGFPWFVEIKIGSVSKIASSYFTSAYH